MIHETHLRNLFVNVNEWLKFAEAKNLGLLTLNGAIIFGITQTDFKNHVEILFPLYYVFIPLSLISFFWCLLSLFPIISKIETGTFKDSIAKFSNWIDKESVFENIHFYGYLRTLSISEFETKFLAKVGSNVNFVEFEKELATQIIYNSRITWLKYQCFKIGAFFFLVAFITTILSLPILVACR